MSRLQAAPTACYSNKIYHLEEIDTFAKSQERQRLQYVQELIKQHWLTNSDEAQAEVEVAIQPEVIKLKADNLLRLTKLRAMQRLRA